MLRWRLSILGSYLRCAQPSAALRCTRFQHGTMLWRIIAGWTDGGCRSFRHAVDPFMDCAPRKSSTRAHAVSRTHYPSPLRHYAHTHTHTPHTLFCARTYVTYTTVPVPSTHAHTSSVPPAPTCVLLPRTTHTPLCAPWLDLLLFPHVPTIPHIFVYAVHTIT